jgi:hypothetical protein
MTNCAPTYFVAWADPLPRLAAAWDDPAWHGAETVGLNCFRPEGSAHRPRTSLRLLHNGRALRGIYQVHDQYVRSIRTRYFDQVWKDSCVEIFLQPKPGGGYFNLEMNAGGAHLCSYIEDPERVPDGFKKSTPLPAEIGARIEVRSSLPGIVEPEITEPVTWQLNFFAPFEVFELYTGALGEVRGQRWRGNFYKCGDESSHPHWGSWAPLEVLNFHTPHSFGTLCFLH